MEAEPRRLRADAERNRRRLVEAATEMIRERGTDVAVSEIAERAGVGRGTLFRHFPSKEALLVAVIAAQMHESTDRARELLDREDPAAALFEVIDESLERQRDNQALVTAFAETWMAHPEIHDAHHDMLVVMEELMARAQETGRVRADVSAVDVILMIKGVCEAQRAFQHIDPSVGQRQLDLVKAALTAHDSGVAPLRGAPPSVADLDRAMTCDPAAVASEPPLAAEA